MEVKKHRERRAQHIFSAPFIYALIVPFVLLDFFLELYHRVCFPLYGIPFVERSRYIRFDRHKLSYLNEIDKINCTYCGYANGLLRYASSIAGETERYWCGIKHQNVIGFIEPTHHRDFLPYGNKEALEQYIKQGRKENKYEEQQEALQE